MSKTMLINTIENHECRIAILDNGNLEELYIERASNTRQVGNIFKGKVTNIEASIQAAFVEYGGNKNGFLHITDVHPKYFPDNNNETEDVGHRTSRKTRPSIQKCLKPGDQVIVQMTKEGIGTKGATLSTYLSLPGRLLVLMPDMKKTGISRKIEAPDTRSKLREILDTLSIPENLGVIVRTAGQDKTKRELQRDVAYLSRLWKSIKKRSANSPTPSEIYTESDLVIRTIRDIYESDITRIICDNQDVAILVREFINLALPRAKCKIEVYTGIGGLFHHFKIDKELENIYSSRVNLPGGGYLVIDQTEALVAIDVNSGKFRKHADAEKNAMELNMNAAREIARQLRLRDMGGVIVIDFVDMASSKYRRQVENEIRDMLKKDKAKSKVSKINSFGLLSLTRQRLRPSLKQNVFSNCPHCDGTGQIMNEESIALVVMRRLNNICSIEDAAEIRISVAHEAAHYLSNHLRDHIANLEKGSGKKIIITADRDLGGNDIQIECISSKGTTIDLSSGTKKAKGKKNDDIKDINSIAPPKAKRDKPKRRCKPKKNTTDNDETKDSDAPEVKPDKDEGKKSSQKSKPKPADKKEKKEGDKPPQKRRRKPSNKKRSNPKKNEGNKNPEKDKGEGEDKEKESRQ